MPASRRAALLGCAAAALAAATAPARPARAAATLVIGSVGDNVKKHLARFQPLADYLAPRLRDAGVEAVRVEVATTAAAMARLMGEGRVDLYLDSPLVIAKVTRLCGAAPFLRRWKDGVAEYRSVLVARRDSGVATLDDLPGRIVGFQDPDSTSGYMLPRAMLRAHGLALVELASPTAAVPAGKVGYVFTRDDENTMLWLVKDRVSLAATDPATVAELEAKRPGLLREVARTADMPRHVVAHRAGLEPAVLAAVGRELLAMEGSDEGRAVLAVTERTARFDHFPGGVAATFAPIHAMLDQLVADGLE